jgi:LysR family transcriptional regulator, hca operon transcriptional activator
VIASSVRWLIPSDVARPLQAEPPTIDLAMGYNKSNTSPLLRRFVSGVDELVAGVQKQSSLKYVQA